MTFRDWLISQKHRHEPIGDLALDVSWDDCSRVTGTMPDLYAHITEHEPCTGAWRALTRAMGEWLIWGYGQPGAGGVQVGAGFGTRLYTRPYRESVQMVHPVAPHLLPEHETGGAGR